MNDLTLWINAPEKIALCAVDSLKPETSLDLYERSSVVLEYDGKELVLRIRARDLSALRAAANTYIRWLDMSMKLVA